MSETAPQTTVATTEVRFSVRALLNCTVVIALIAAALGPYFRSLAPEVRYQAGILWGVCISLTALMIAHSARTRMRLEHESGKLLLELKPASRSIAASGPLLSYLSGAFLIAIGIGYLLFAANVLAGEKSFGGQLYYLTFFGLICGRVISVGITTVWWNRTVQFREHGVLHGLRYLRWSHVTDCRFSRWKNLFSFEGVDHRHRDMRLDAVTAASDVEPALAIVGDKLATVLGNDSTTPPDALAATPHFKIPKRPEKIARGCFVGLVAYVMGGVVFGLTLNLQSSAFRYGLFVGFAVTALYVALSARRSRNAGRPRIRLTRAFDWQILLACLGSTALLFYIGNELLQSVPLLVPATGFASGLMLFAAAGLIFQYNVDLCDNGLVIAYWLFWPWENITVWQQANRVTFRRGLSRVTAVVPDELRELVERILKEKGIV